MPSLYIVKRYIEGGFYHICNRGISRNNIFLDHEDYSLMYKLLLHYLTPEGCPDFRTRSTKNLSETLKMLSYIFMPNHFHFQIQQLTARAMPEFMHCVTAIYTRYFNSKYHRLGPLFQSRYKAVEILTDAHLLHVGRYIHLNALPIVKDRARLFEYPYSSYAHYLGKYHTPFIYDSTYFSIMRGYFGGSVDSTREEYRRFVECDLFDDPDPKPPI